MSKYGVISGPYFPVIGLNTEIYFEFIQFECRTIRTKNNSVFGHFSRTVKPLKSAVISLGNIVCHFSSETVM